MASYKEYASCYSQVDKLAEMSERPITLSKKRPFKKKAQAKLSIQSQQKTASAEYISAIRLVRC